MVLWIKYKYIFKIIILNKFLRIKVYFYLSITMYDQDSLFSIHIS